MSTTPKHRQFLAGRTEVTYTSDWANGNVEYGDHIVLLEWLASRGEDTEDWDELYAKRVASDALDNLHRGGFDPIDIEHGEPGDVQALMLFMAALRVSGERYLINRRSSS